MTAALEALVAAELAAPLPEPVRLFAAQLATRCRRPPVGVLFYGSSLRTGDLGGILDFYVLVERVEDWPQGRFAALANRLLPPNVEYHETVVAGVPLRAKVAVLTLAAFRRRAAGRGVDTTIWARFAQPVGIAWARDDAARHELAASVALAVATAADWAVRLAPDAADDLDRWRALFRRTYAAELRVEKGGRADSVVDAAPDRYRQAMAAARDGDGAKTSAKPATAEAAWARRRRLAKPLNLARLAKAAFTFRGASDYLAWKVGRHAGAPVVLTTRQRRWPPLAFAAITWRLWRRRRRGDG